MIFSRNTWILLGILVVLVGVAFFIPYYQGKQPKPTPTASAAVAQPVVAGGQVAQFTLQAKDGNKVVVKSVANNGWTVVDPANLTYDPTAVQTAAQFFKTAMVQTALPTQPPADAMGISSPTVSVILLMADGSQKTMKVGSPTPTGDGYYVQVDAAPAFTVSATDLSSLLALLTAGKPPVTPSVPSPQNGTPGAPGNSSTQLPPIASPTSP
jgi:hypothetical protein